LLIVGGDCWSFGEHLVIKKIWIKVTPDDGFRLISVSDVTAVYSVFVFYSSVWAKVVD